MPRIGDIEELAQAPVAAPRYDPRNASASDFGAGLGQAMQQAGDVAERLAALQQRDQMQLAEFNRSKALVDFEAAARQKLAEAARNVSGGGQDFTKAFMAGVDKDSQDWLDANLAGASPQDRAQWQAKASALRADIAADALRVEFAERDRHYGVQLADGQNKLLNGIGPDPKSFDAALSNGQALIDASGLPAGQKETLKSAWTQAATLAYGRAINEVNPDALRAALAGDLHGAPTGDAISAFKAKLRGKGGKESASDTDKAGTSTAVGRYQLTKGWWTRIINSAEGKAAGLKESDRANPDKQEIAMDIAVKGYARTLAAAGAPASEANLYMVHFLGDAGFAKAWKALQKDGGKADAAAMFPEGAAANKTVFYKKDENGERTVPRTIAEVYANQTRGLGDRAVVSKADPRLAGLSYEAKVSLLDASERQIKQNEAEARAAEVKAHGERLNALQVELMDGKAGLADIDNARKAGWLTDGDEIAKMQNIVHERDKALGALSGFITGVQTPGFAWNPYDDKQVKQVEAGTQALAQKLVKDAAASGQQMSPQDALLQAGAQVFTQTGMVPKSFGVTLRGGLVSADPARVQAAANIASNMLAKNPNAFAGVEGGSDIAKAAVLFDHRVNDLGDSAEQAAKVVALTNDPQFKSKVRVGDTELADFGKKLARDNPGGALVAKLGGGGGVGFAGGAAGRNAIFKDYAELASQYYLETGDEKAAKAMAVSRLTHLYGVFNGAIMKYPPQRGYPPVPGDSDKGYGYIMRQALADIKSEAKHTPKAEDVMLTPVPVVTGEAWRQKKAAPYTVSYWTETGGQRTLHVLPKAFYADPRTAVEELKAQAKARFDAQAGARKEREAAYGEAARLGITGF